MPFLELGAYRTLDLSGDEFAQPIETFVPLYRAAKPAGLRLKAHVGEWGTADDVQRAVEVLELDISRGHAGRRRVGRRPAQPADLDAIREIGGL
jgi:adenosine deaminase